MKMKELRIGQSVMTLDKEGSPAVTTFLGWLHKDTTLEAEFLEITTEDGHKITLTPTHIIMVNSGMKLASQVTIGDQLLSKTGPVVVLTIERVITRGVYSPLTTSSTVLVSGVLCSCFAATNHNNIAQGMVTNYHIQAHTCFAPVRALPALLEDNYSQDKVRSLSLSTMTTLVCRTVSVATHFFYKELLVCFLELSAGKMRKTIQELLFFKNYIISLMTYLCFKERMLDMKNIFHIGFIKKCLMYMLTRKLMVKVLEVEMLMEMVVVEAGVEGHVLEQVVVEEEEELVEEMGETVILFLYIMKNYV